MSFFSFVMFVISTIYQQQAASAQRKRQKKMQEEAERRADAAKGLQIAVEATAAPILIPYGRCLIGGVRVYHNTFSSISYRAVGPNGTEFNNIGKYSGTKHEYLLVQQVISVGKIHKIIGMMIDDKPHTDSSFGSSYCVHAYTVGGTPDEMTSVTDASRAEAKFTKVAFASAFFRLNRDEPQFSGVPNLSFLIEGLEIRPVTGPRGNRTLGSPEYSNSGALATLDYLLSADYGRGLSVNDVDLDSFYDGDQLCKVVVKPSVTIEGNLWKLKKAADESVVHAVNRFETNAVLSTADSIRDNIEKLLEGMDMAELVWSGGRYRLQLAYPCFWSDSQTFDNQMVAESNSRLFRSLQASNLNHPVSDTAWWAEENLPYIDDSDILAEGDASVSWPSAQNRFNFMTVRFRNEAKDFVEDTAVWPEKSSETYMTFMQEDQQTPLESDIYEDCVTDSWHAVAKAEQRVRQSRYQVLHKLLLRPRLVILEPGDIIRVNSEAYNIPARLMRVEEVNVTVKGYVEVELSTFSSEVLAWNADDAIYVKPKTTYDLSLPQVVNLNFSRSSQLVGAIGRLTWNYANDARVNRYHVMITDTPEEFINSSTKWTELGVTPNNYFDIQPVIAGSYVFAVVSGSSTSKAPKFNNLLNSRWPTVSVGLGVAVINNTSLCKIAIYKKSPVMLGPPSGGSYDFNTQTPTIPSGWSTIVPVGSDTLYVSYAVAEAVGAVTVDDTLTWSAPAVLTDTANYAKPTNVYLIVDQDANGVRTFERANGDLQIFENSVNVSQRADMVYSVESVDGCTATVSNVDGSKGHYAVTAMVSKTASFTLLCTSNTTIYRKVISVITLTAVAGGSVVADPTPPPAPTQATLLAGPGVVFVDLAALPVYTEGHGHGMTVIYGSLINDIQTAEVVMEMIGTSDSFAAPFNTTIYIWTRNRSSDGVLSVGAFYVGVVTVAGVGSTDIASGAIRDVHIQNATITGAKIKDGEITTAKIANIISSTNYVAGETGWAISKSGGAELNDVVVRGEIHAESGTFAGQLNAANGSFVGDISGASGTFTGGLNVASAGSGARVETRTTGIKVFDANGICRVKIGDLS